MGGGYRKKRSLYECKMVVWRGAIMNKYIKYYVFVLIIGIILTGCHKNTVTLTDDTWYIVDNNTILMLCEDAEQEPYKTLVTQLKGNGDALRSSIEKLTEMKSDVKTENALGVAYLRLRKFEDAKRYLETALNLSVTEEQKACVLTNLSAYYLFQGKSNEAYSYSEQAYKTNISDSIKRLILDSNMLMVRYIKNTETNNKKTIKEGKKLIKEEKKLLGCNKEIGIFNYYILAKANYNSGNNDFGDFYMKKALRLNNKTYQRNYIEANLYQEMSYYYFYYWNNFDKAIECATKSIEILEKWQAKDHYDLLIAYYKRGDLYYLHYDNSKALDDYEIALEQCSSYPALASLLYFELGNIYERSEQFDKSAECFIRSYFIWQQEKFEAPLGLNKDILEYVYDNLVQTDLDYESWSQEQLKQAEIDIKDKWGE